MDTPKPLSTPVPKVLWDELENALWIRSKELIADIAKTLGQDPKPLLQEFKSKKSNLYLIELERDAEEQFECCALNFSKGVAHKCRRPVLYGSTYCPSHQFFLKPKLCETKPKVQRIQDEDSLFGNTVTSKVYTEEFESTGFLYLQSNKCIVLQEEA